MNLLHAGGVREHAAKALGCSVNKVYAALRALGCSTKADLPALQRAATRAGVLGVRSPVPETLQSPEAEGGFGFTYDVAEGVSQVRMLEELKRLAQGKGGQVGQANLYLDPEGALDWIAYIRQEPYQSVQRGIPLDELAAEIHRAGTGPRLDVFALGAGTAEQEVRLVELLLESCRPRDLRLYLIDLSIALLTEGKRHAEDTLGELLGVTTFAVNDDFTRLPQSTNLFYQNQRAPRQRVCLMFGGTFGNLDNEPRFIENALGCFQPGDFLALHFCLAGEDDPRKKRSLPEWERAFERFITGPLRRHSGAAVTKVETISVAGDFPIPGSYTLKSKVELSDGRSFHVGSLRRYEPGPLGKTLESLGWRCIRLLPYQHMGEVQYPQALLLCQKVQP